MYNTQEIARRIKSRLKLHKKTHKEMLSELCLGINTISELAKGKNMSYLTFAKIADYLDCSVDYLLCRTDNPNIHNNSTYCNNCVNYNPQD